jgi:hypothetical protein
VRATWRGSPAALTPPQTSSTFRPPHQIDGAPETRRSVPDHDDMTDPSVRAATADLAPNRTRTLRNEKRVRRVAVVDRLKLCLLVLVVMASGLVLLALAAFVVLTNTVALVITLAILGTIVLLLGRSALAEARKMSAGR